MELTRKNRIAAALLVGGVVWAGTAAASSGGIFGFARPETGSCGFCHGIVPGGTYPVPVLHVDGLPASYTPGEAYELTIIVAGPLLPLAGFNLEATGGRLSQRPSPLPEGGSSQTNPPLNECRTLELAGKCVDGVCEVRIAEECPHYGPEYPDCACLPADIGTDLCRPCDSTLIVSAQASHTARATLPVWNVGWTAPDCGFGEVRFYLAGNSVNGVLENDPGDVWAVLPEPLVVPEGSCQ